MRRISLLLLAATLGVGLCYANQAKPEKKLKMRIAVAQLDWNSHEYWNEWQIPIEFKNAIQEKLIKKLMDTGRFVVLEREAMEALEKEQAIKEENTGQSQKGKIIPAQALVRGKVTDFEMSRSSTGGGVNIGGIGRVGGAVTQAKMAINVRIFNVDTSEMLASEEAAGKVSSTSFKFDGNSKVAFADFASFEKSPLGEATTKAIDQAVEKVLAKLEKTAWSCRVADFDAPTKEVTLNAGSEVGVSVGDTFEVHKIVRVIKDPETGAILGTRTSKVGTIKVIEVDKKFSIATVVDGDGFETGAIVKEVGSK
ncbi:MAG: hypothetical protein KF784_06255 [Fimbriimonadaceae bacterium]|nr:hypothetical protein [Fimbriimonadaceae bacterium]